MQLICICMQKKKKNAAIECNWLEKGYRNHSHIVHLIVSYAELLYLFSSKGIRKLFKRTTSNNKKQTNTNTITNSANFVVGCASYNKYAHHSKIDFTDSLLKLGICVCVRYRKQIYLFFHLPICANTHNQFTLPNFTVNP